MTEEHDTRTVYTQDEEHKSGYLRNIHCQKEPYIGQLVEIFSAATNILLAIGRVVKISPDPEWPGHWLYNVQVFA